MSSSSKKTPTRTTRSSAVHRPDSVRRNLNRSFGSPKKTPRSPRKPPTPRKAQEATKTPKELTLVINRRSQTCHYKHFFYESYSESDEDTSDKLVVTGKRQIRTPLKYNEDFVPNSPKTKITPTKKTFKRDFTPLKNKLLQLDIARTPRTPRNAPSSSKNTPTRTPKLSAAKSPKTTPRNKLKLIREGVITPSVQSRDRAVKLDSTPLTKARSHLHVSYVPRELPCREREYDDVFDFLKGKLLDKSGGCMYISGVPGTGKTATVTAAINKLHLIADEGDIVNFTFVSINGMKLTEPRQAYVEIYRQLNGRTVAWEQAHNILEDKFTKKSKKEQPPIILLVDELDIICTKRQDVVYNLLDWPTKAHTQLIVITIANTMDLPERLLMNRVTSRLGLTRLTFQAYTFKQLQEIVTNRLMGSNSFNPDAVQLVARKVASVSGDARRALDICRRAAEIAELEGSNTLVTMTHVNEALKAMITQPKVRAIKSCSRLEQYILQAVLSEVERTGIEETMFSEVYKMLVSLMALNGFHIVSSTIALAAVAKLSACRLLLVDQKCSDLNQKIVLNVSPDDIHFAL